MSELTRDAAAVEGASPPTYARASMNMRDARRANRLDERHAVAVALVGGAIAAFADAAPTGSPWVDRPMIFLAVGVVTWAAASASWWAVSAAAGVAAVAAIDPLLTMIGAVGFVGGLWIGVRRRDLGAARAVVATIALNVLVRLGLEGFFGFSAIVGIGVGVVLFLTGLRRRPRATRRTAWAAVGGALTLAVLAVIAFALTATSARAALSDGQRLATQGIAELSRGDFASASTSFADAGRAFTRANHELNRPWARPAQFVPVVAQHAETLSDLAGAAGGSSSELGTALAAIDPDTLRLVDGRVDLAAIEAVAPVLADVQTSLIDLGATVDGANSPWLVEPLRRRIDTLAEDIDDNEEQLDHAVVAAQLAPQMLGRDGPRRYLFIFTTPAEARGLGGFMGNFVEVQAVDGELTVTRFGRTGELNVGGPDPIGRVVTGPEEWLDQWGRYGFRGPTGSTAVEAWSNITMSPNFPSTGQVIAELYPQSGGQPIDGVFALDPYVIAALLDLTGPIQVPSSDGELNSANVVPFLVQSQYEIDDRPERIDLLQEVSETAVDRLLTGALPNPTRLAESLGGVVRQGRLVGWSATTDEEALFDSIGMSGALPTLDGADGVAVVVNNAAANKIDVYLQRSVTYHSTVDLATGQTSGTLEVTLTNSAPSTGLPAVVIGNQIGQPPGTNRSLVSFYTALSVVSMTRGDGEVVPFESGQEGGWNTARISVTLPAGSAVTFTLNVTGQLDTTSAYVLFTRVQPMVLPEQQDLVVTSATGDALVSAQGEAAGEGRYVAATRDPS